MGGIGKTALALKLAAELKPHYPDAQFYLDLKGVDPQPLTAAQAMAHVIRSCHPEARLPESEAELAGLYRSVLDGRRALLLMDNAAGKEQVEPLIPSDTSLLLVTSRSHFKLAGSFVRDLDELSAKDASELLLKIEPRIDGQADTIAQLCGRLPLALRVSGSALAERPDLSPTDYARRLKERKERFDPVDASLTLSYELLTEDRRRLWRLLAVFPGTFTAPAAAAVWELETDPASSALGDLARSSLVEWEEKEQRYRLHDLARSFADRQLAETERGAAQRRHAEYFLEFLRATDNLYLKGGESVSQALRLFDAEWGNIQAGFAWASVRFQDDDTAVRICNDYPNAGVRLLWLRQHPRERIRWQELALIAARQRRNRAMEGSHLCNLGLAYKDLGELRRAIECYEQALAIARELGDRQGQSSVFANLGGAYWNLGEPRRAIECHEQDLAIVRELGDRRGEGQTLNNLGLAYADLDEPRRAIELFEQHLGISRELGDRRGEGRALNNLGLAYANLGEPRRAIELFAQCLVISRELGYRWGEGTALGNLGLAYADLGESRRAIEYYEQWLAIMREIGDRHGEAKASWNLGLTIEKEGTLARAADLMRVRVDYEYEIGHPDAEKHAAEVAALRARVAEQGS